MDKLPKLPLLFIRKIQVLGQLLDNQTTRPINCDMMCFYSAVNDMELRLNIPQSQPKVKLPYMSTAPFLTDCADKIGVQALQRTVLCRALTLHALPIITRQSQQMTKIAMLRNTWCKSYITQGLFTMARKWWMIAASYLSYLMQFCEMSLNNKIYL